MNFENTLSLRIYPKNWYDVCYFKDYFKNPNYPLNIDIGSGKGRFIYGRSKNIPKENFLGIERQLGRINKTSKMLFGWSRKCKFYSYRSFVCYQIFSSTKLHI